MKRSTTMRALAGFALAVSCAACGGGSSQPQGGGIGAQTGAITSDTEVMREAQGAANELVRNAQDCDAVKAALPEVNRKLDEAASKIKTSTGQTTLAAVRSRVSAIAQACP
jgi:hypothetical protein